MAERFRWDKVCALLFVVVLALGMVLSYHIGAAWDEPDNIYAGGVYWNFFTQGFKPEILVDASKSASYFGKQIFTQEPSLARYPPVPLYIGTLLAVLGQKIGVVTTAQDIFVAFHWASALFLALLVVYTYRWAKLLKLKPLSCLFAALSVFLYPTIAGHGLSSLKDIAQVSLFTVSLYYLVCFSLDKQRKYFIYGTILWGLGLATKFNAIYVPIVWACWEIFHANRLSGRVIVRMLAHIMFIILIGVATACIMWPYVWFDPMRRVLEVISYFTSVGKGFALWFDGNKYPVGVGVPVWWFPWATFLVVTPIMYLFLWLVGSVQTIVSSKSNKLFIILLIWFLLPLFRSFFPQSSFYDGIRHFMEVIPAGMLLSALAIDRLISERKSAWVGYAILVVALCWSAIILIRLFPYEAGYINSIGIDPNMRYDRDIEGLAVREGMQYIHSTYPLGKVWVPIAGHLAWYHSRFLEEFVTAPTEAETVLLINKSSHVTRKDAEALMGPTFSLDYTIKRGTSIFGWIYRKK